MKNAISGGGRGAASNTTIKYKTKKVASEDGGASKEEDEMLEYAPPSSTASVHTKCRSQLGPSAPQHYLGCTTAVSSTVPMVHSSGLHYCVGTVRAVGGDVGMGVWECGWGVGVGGLDARWGMGWDGVGVKLLLLFLLVQMLLPNS